MIRKHKALKFDMEREDVLLFPLTIMLENLTTEYKAAHIPGEVFL